MNFFIATLLAAASIAYADDKSDKVTITYSPVSAVVIDADYVLNDSQTIHAPWMAQEISINNASDEAVTILAIQYFVSDGDSKSQITVSPNFYNFTLVCQGDGGGHTQDIEYTDFGQYAPGEASALKLQYRGQLGAGCPPGVDQLPTLYVEHLGTLGHHVFKIEMHMIGWFGTVQNPTARFEKIVNFITN